MNSHFFGTRLSRGSISDVKIIVVVCAALVMIDSIAFFNPNLSIGRGEDYKRFPSPPELPVKQYWKFRRAAL